MTGLSDSLAQPPEGQVKRETLGRIAELLTRNGIDIDEVGQVKRISLYQSLTKNDEGEAEIHDLVGIQLMPNWADGPEWPVCQQAAPTVVKPAKPRSEKRSGRVTVILPDPQIGYRRLSTGELVPTHDLSAIDVALQIVADVRPDTIINLGDTLDLPEWSSKFLVLPEFVLTTQPTIDYAHQFLAIQRATAPEAKIVLLAGNHDDRIGKAIAKNAMAALRLKRANLPDSWPVLSIPYLLRLDELAVEYVGAYPAGRYQITRGSESQTPLFAVHGERLDVAKVAKSERQSFVQGHIHRMALHSETYEVRGRPETVVAFSPGCLCRIDGAVPSTKSGVDDVTGRPYERWENWQQGMAIVTETDDGAWSTELVQIHHGNAVYRGKTYINSPAS